MRRRKWCRASSVRDAESAPGCHKLSDKPRARCAQSVPLHPGSTHLGPLAPSADPPRLRPRMALAHTNGTHIGAPAEVSLQFAGDFVEYFCEIGVLGSDALCVVRSQVHGDAI